MSCFIVPLVQAIATSTYRKHHESVLSDPKAPVLMRQIPALEKMLWGGTVMLIVDHIINALGQTGGFQVMLREMLTVGVPMSLVLTAFWAVYSYWKEHRPAKQTI